MYLYSINTMVYCPNNYTVASQSHFQTDVHCTHTEACSLAKKLYTFPLPNQVKSNQAE